MTYPTDPVTLRALSDDEWDALLASVWNAPVPRVLVRVSSDPEPTRRERAERMLGEGLNRKQIAAAFNVSVSMLSLILSGKRN